MPIYDYNGHKRETLEVEYLDGDKHFARTTRVVRFGSGDIRIGAAKSESETENEITFGPQDPTPIGTKDDNAIVTDPAVRLVFDKVEGLDSVIAMCLELRKKMA